MMRKGSMEKRCHLNIAQKDELGFNMQIKERAGRVEGDNGLEAWPGYHRMFQTQRRGDSAWSRGFTCGSDLKQD